MKKQFSAGFFGYKKHQVEQYIHHIKKDYEDELGKKKDRMMELIEENRLLKLELEAKDREIKKYADQEKYVLRALVEAEQRAQAIIESSRQRSREELDAIYLEKARWNEKIKAIRCDLLTFEQTIADILDRFRDEINYHAAKEISQTLLLMDEEEIDEIEKEIKKVIA